MICSHSNATANSCSFEVFMQTTAKHRRRSRVSAENLLHSSFLSFLMALLLCSGVIFERAISSSLSNLSHDFFKVFVPVTFHCNLLVSRKRLFHSALNSERLQGTKRRRSRRRVFLLTGIKPKKAPSIFCKSFLLLEHL